MIINGIELEDIDIFDEVVYERYKVANKRVVAAAEKNKNLKEAGEMIRKQCNSIFCFFNDVIGEGTDKKIFGDKVSLKVCIQAFVEFNDYVAKEIETTNGMVSKYSHNRATRRANK